MQRADLIGNIVIPNTSPRLIRRPLDLDSNLRFFAGRVEGNFMGAA